MIAEVLKTSHQPLFVEVELTSYCNARCVHCPRENMRPSTQMTEETFRAILDRYCHYRDELWNNTGATSRPFPKLIFAGGGEPDLHPAAATFIREAKESHFYTKVYSNAALLTRDYVDSLVESQVDEISISCHGITPREVRATMGLKKHETMMANIDYLHAQLRDGPGRMYVTYNALDELESTDDEIHSFWSKKNIDCIGPNPVWNRAGELRNLPARRRASVPSLPVNFDHAMWCVRLSYFDSITANGDYVFCGYGLFSKDAPIVGNVHTDTLSDVHASYERVLKRKAENAMCRTCVKPSERYVMSEIIDALENEMSVRF